jgi:hypothetical protein
MFISEFFVLYPVLFYICFLIASIYIFVIAMESPGLEVHCVDLKITSLHGKRK